MLREEFTERMKKLLGEQYEAFISALDEPPVRSLRVNTLKISEEDFLASTDLCLEKIPYAKGGYTVLSGGEGLGNTPAHHAGQFYVQDGGAMSAVAALPRLPAGAEVADLCAAPGGKSSQLLSLLGDEGFLLSNEYVPKRAKILVENFERLGVKRAVVTSLDVSRLVTTYEGRFDAVVVDAPCSGEGMFRKGDVARSEWSPEAVKASAERQREILSSAGRLVKHGGYLLYSTCTYSLEENEMQIDGFLNTHADFELIRIENEALISATADGILFEGAKEKNLRLCRRFYPHLAPGEGQFIALMRRCSGEDEKPKIPARDTAIPLTRDELKIVNDFILANLSHRPEGRLVRHLNYVVLIPHSFPVPSAMTFMSGVVVGEIRGKLLFPHHQLFSAYGRDFIRKEELLTEERAERYLRGEEIEYTGSGSGFVAVTWQGTPLGGGKASSGRIKNHYPKGLRLRG